MWSLRQALLMFLILLVSYQSIVTFEFRRSIFRVSRNMAKPNAIQGLKFHYSPTLLQSSKDWTQLPENIMSIDEIKSELELRSVDYRDCISRRELVEKLVEARATGKADPKIIDKFNEQIQTAEVVDVSNIDEERFQQAKAQDGGLPGGLNADAIKALVGNPKIVQLLRDPKMQEMMRTVMTGGQEAFKKKYVADPGNFEFSSSSYFFLSKIFL